MRSSKPLLFTGLAAVLASVLGLSAPANAALTANSLTANALTANALTANALTANSIALNSASLAGTGAESTLPPLRGLTLPSGASFSLAK